MIFCVTICLCYKTQDVQRTNVTVRTPLMEALAAAEAFALAFVFFAVLEVAFGFAAVKDISFML